MRSSKSTQNGFTRRTFLAGAAVAAAATGGGVEAVRGERWSPGEME